ncbi:hypothetical protein KKF34_02945 [Myxococcota bacterium]|nr:hypothetical protein [Myxococcota bacterium]MBU1382601.1 hypothetical protein [Myxococcota bacterium]MBU1495818.1 hypothetical protein [Myxococcota bacterium]
MKKLHSFGILAVIIGLISCEKHDDKSEKLCERYSECNAMEYDECLSSIGSLSLSSDCYDSMMDTTCEDHLSAPPSYFGTCFPYCSVESRECRNDKIYLCNGTYEMVYNCEKVCEYAYDGAEYTGTCGTVAPNGEISAEEVCWCQY